MRVADAYLLTPRSLPGGRVEWSPTTDIIRKLREGDATLNWEGDPTLSLVLDSVGRRWQVWRAKSDGSADLICSAPKRPGNRLPGNELIRMLVAHDTRHVNVFAEVERHNQAIERARDDEAHAQNGDIADKLAWAFGRDLDIPAQSGRPYPVAKPEAP